MIAAADFTEEERADHYFRLKVEGILEAPVTICVTSDPTQGGDHVLGRNFDEATDVYSTSCAIQNFWLAARAEGVAVGWVSIFKKSDVRRILGIPAHVNPIALLCVGYTERFPELPLLELEGWAGRLPADDLINHEQWGDVRVMPPEESLVLISACLAGVHCRFDGGHCLDEEILNLVRQGRAILVCPEQLGGLPTPREPAEIAGGDGADVLAGRARVLTSDGRDVTDAFVRGARETARLAQLAGARRAILKARSPSCGAGIIYDGTHSGRTRPGDGVTATLLKKAGLDVEAR